MNKKRGLTKKLLEDKKDKRHPKSVTRGVLRAFFLFSETPFKKIEHFFLCTSLIYFLFNV